jgi:Butirosin biosynthesis protein H, N-terminal
VTTRKHFKQLVRDRMARTGERYTVARAYVAAKAAPPSPEEDEWALRGGVDADTAAFANVLANAGIVAPHTGAELSEAMVLGLGGGLGAGYILWEFADHALRSRILVLGFRRQWQYPARWAAETADRLGLHADLHETGGAGAAAKRLDAALDRGLPAILWIDPYRLGHRHLPDWLDGYGDGTVVAYGRARDGGVLIDDRSTGRLTVPEARLAEARGRVISYKNRLIEIDPALVEIDGQRLRDGIREALALQVEHLSEPSDSFSLPAWAKWARLLGPGRNKKAWPTVFADGRGLGSALASIHDNAGNRGHLRDLYAGFLREAAPLVELPLGAAADAWDAACLAWDDLVEVAMTAHPDLEELRRLMDATAVAVDRGDAAAEEATDLAARRWDLQERLDAELPVDPAELFPRLQEGVTAIHAAEVRALDALRSAVEG